MGEQSGNKFSDPQAKKRFTRMLLRDISALERMLDEDLIESGVTRIGAEQELCLVNNEFYPSTNNLEVLDAINDEHFVSELAKFNIEANLDPQEFSGDCFKHMEKQLRDLMDKAHAATEDRDTRIVMTGILPTIRKEHLEFKYMTPNERYKILNDVMKSQRGSNFEMHMMGVDELFTSHSNILFEACNTSFQVHMQISPEEFVQKYNWAQMISGPIMAATANSPLLLGKRLWKETRIALFQQSVDMRSSTNIKRDQEPRVTFGRDWLRGSIIDLYRDNVSRFHLLFASDMEEDAHAVLDQGGNPRLCALNLHNGTVYKWNRACYGVGNGKAHLRIENRYLPSGPTVKDEMANAALWLGVMYAMPKQYANLPEIADFEEVRYNFYKACRNGLDCQFKWFGQVKSAIKVLQKVIIPLARKGLKAAGVDQSSIDELIGIIEERVKTKRNGAQWMTKNFTTLLKGSTANEASKNITEALYERQMTSRPVHEWDDVDPESTEDLRRFSKVSDIMETELFIAKEDDIVELAIKMMDWKKIRSIPVENNKNQLVGLITPREIMRYHAMDDKEKPESVKEIMCTDYIVVSPRTPTQELVDLMGEKRVACVMVLDGKHLAGIISEGDIVQVVKRTKLFKNKK